MAGSVEVYIGTHNHYTTNMTHHTTTPHMFVRWQVFFLPIHGTLEEVKSYIAFCPFTGIKASGTSIVTAAKGWLKAVKKAYPQNVFSIPKYMITTRKIWYGERSHSNTEEIYVIELQSADKVVGFNPNTLETIEFQECVDTAPLSIIGDKLLPTCDGNVVWSDWRVECTPIMLSHPPTQTVHLVNSLTPHCLN